MRRHRSLVIRMGHILLKPPRQLVGMVRDLLDRNGHIITSRAPVGDKMVFEPVSPSIVELDTGPARFTDQQQARQGARSPAPQSSGLAARSVVVSIVVGIPAVPVLSGRTPRDILLP